MTTETSQPLAGGDLVGPAPAGSTENRREKKDEDPKKEGTKATKGKCLAPNKNQNRRKADCD